MDATMINKWGKYIPCFLGTYALNELTQLNIIKNDLSFIVINQGHAIGVLITSQSIDVFDPLGKQNHEVYDPICQFLSTHACSKRINISVKIQADNSDLCATFCLVFLKLRCQGYNFSEVISIFSGKVCENDKKVNQLFKKLFKYKNK